MNLIPKMTLQKCCSQEEESSSGAWIRCWDELSADDFLDRSVQCRNNVASCFPKKPKIFTTNLHNRVFEGSSYISFFLNKELSYQQIDFLLFLDDNHRIFPSTLFTPTPLSKPKIPRRLIEEFHFPPFPFQWRWLPLKNHPASLSARRF